MKYTEKYKIKWHDTDASRNVRYSQMLVYMQETANLQLESMGRSLDAMRDTEKLGFILSKIKLVFHAPLKAYDEIEVSTWTCGGRGYSFNRCFEIRRGDDLIAEAISFWALLDIESRRLVRCEGFSLGTEDEEPLCIEVPRRIKFPEFPLEMLGKREIRYSDLDYNMHMNNTKYPDMLCDFMPIDKVGDVKEMTLEFLHESAYKDVLSFHVAEENGAFYFKTQNEKGDICLTAQVVTE